MEQQCTHAVVLTKRLQGEDGNAVQSPFEGVNDPSQTSALQGSDVHEHVLAAFVGLNKAEAFSCIKPFHGAIGHRGSPF